ncbi:MAG: hypothetical protein FGM46_07855, partial [Ferruginibacter sp.]|nr:hypothetical protein [Ferruginibacter sp.]
MKTAVCTLFEGNYHLGVGALINSLIDNGFNGDVYVGYRGNLPNWFKQYEKLDIQGWGMSPFKKMKNGSSVYFLCLDTDIHLTNYKPQFLIRLTTGVCKYYEAIAYFDPDIVVCRNWIYFEDWMKYGVAVVHDIIMHDMPTTHPLRRNWESIAKKKGYLIHHQLDSYVNAGFCGLSKPYWEFPFIWKEVLDVALNEFSANAYKLRS